MSNRTICLILGGGVGSRLFPLTAHHSKPAVPIGGKYRLIDIPIANCLHSGMDQIFVLTQYNAASLNQHIKNTYHFDGFSNRQVGILAAEQRADSMGWYQGTADAVRQSLTYIDQLDYDELIVLSGDQLFRMDLAKMLAVHQTSKADITIATKPVTSADASRFGVMKTNLHQRITHFVEKPALGQLSQWQSPVDMPYQLAGEHFLASMGIYIFSRSAIHRLFSDLPDALDFGKEVIPYAIESGYSTQSYLFGGYWEDIGTIKSYFSTNMELAKQTCGFRFNTDQPIFTMPAMQHPTIVKGTRMENVLLGEGGCVAAESIKDAVLGNQIDIGVGTQIDQCVIIGNSYQTSDCSIQQPKIGIGKHCTISRAIIDKNARIGDGVSIIGEPNLADQETEQYCIRDGIVVIKANAVIADGMVIGKTGTAVKNMSRRDTEIAEV